MRARARLVEPGIGQDSPSSPSSVGKSEYLFSGSSASKPALGAQRIAQSSSPSIIHRRIPEHSTDVVCSPVVEFGSGRITSGLFVVHAARRLARTGHSRRLRLRRRGVLGAPHCALSSGAWCAWPSLAWSEPSGQAERLCECSALVHGGLCPWRGAHRPASRGGRWPRPRLRLCDRSALPGRRATLLRLPRRASSGGDAFHVAHRHGCWVYALGLRAPCGASAIGTNSCIGMPTTQTGGDTQVSAHRIVINGVRPGSSASGAPLSGGQVVFP